VDLLPKHTQLHAIVRDVWPYRRNTPEGTRDKRQAIVINADRDEEAEISAQRLWAEFMVKVEYRQRLFQ
jgi:hypothetical protein